MSFPNAIGIKLTFDKEIITDVEQMGPLAIATKAYAGAMTYFASALYDPTYAIAKAFDKDMATAWLLLNETSGFIGADLGSAKTLGKARVYIGPSWHAGNYKFQGSDDNANWTDLKSGTLPTTTGWYDMAFTPAMHRYWRLNLLTRITYICVYELEFFEMLPSFKIDGWAITGKEYDKVPGGNLKDLTYPLERVTKAPDNLSLILWLMETERMKYPVGEVQVAFTGDLRGLGNVSVLSFTQGFTPINISPFFNPNALEKVEILAAAIPSTNLMNIFYQDTKAGTERVEATNATATGTITLVSQLP